MTTSQELNDSFDSLSHTAMKVKRERDALLAAAKLANVILLQQKNYSDMDNEAMDILQTAIQDAEEPANETRLPDTDA